jgi:hypothetical protein
VVVVVIVWYLQVGLELTCSRHDIAKITYPLTQLRNCSAFVLSSWMFIKFRPIPDVIAHIYFAFIFCKNKKRNTGNCFRIMSITDLKKT